MPSLLATVDLEEFVLPVEAGLDTGDAVVFDTSRQGLDRLAALFRRTGVRATFFTTIAFARRFPEAVAALAAEGHELGLHCLDHADDYAAMAPSMAAERLAAGRRELMERFGVPVTGFRAARLAAPAPAVLREVGFVYDSSLHPTWVPGRYNNLRASRTPFRRDGIVEVPISVTRRLRLPVSWFWLRNLGAAYGRLCLRSAMAETGYLNVYVHPWEFADLPRLRFRGIMRRLSVRRTGERFVRLFEGFLRAALRRGLVPRTLDEFVRDLHVT